MSNPFEPPLDHPTRRTISVWDLTACGLLCLGVFLWHGWPVGEALWERHQHSEALAEEAAEIRARLAELEDPECR